MMVNREPPAWDAFSKVNVKAIDWSEYEEDHERAAREKKKETAVVKAKPTSINGWDPETQTQHILTEEQMQQGGGMGAMDLDDWRVTSLEARDVGNSFDCSHGARTVMKQLVMEGVGSTNPQPPSQVEVTYRGRDRESGLVFDEASFPRVFNLDAKSAQLDNRWPVLSPPGLVQAVRTMRVHERAKLTLLPEQGFGRLGSETLGVPPEAYLEYDIELHRVIPVTKYDDGGIVKRLLFPSSMDAEAARQIASGPASPQINFEVVVKWGGHLVEDAAAPGAAFVSTNESFRDESLDRFWLGDPKTPAFWRHVLPSFRVGEVAELTLDAAAAFGEDGSVEHNVPPQTAIRLMATLVSLVAVNDLSPAQDRSALRTVATPALSYTTPIERYDCTVDVSVSLIPPPPSSLSADAAADARALAATTPVVELTGAVVTLGLPMVDAEELRRACGGLDVDEALQLLLPRMGKSETSELLYTPSAVHSARASSEGGGGEASPVVDVADEAHHQPALALRSGLALRLVVTLRSWVAVDVMEGTGGATGSDEVVTKRVLHCPAYVPGGGAEATVPKPEAICRVRYRACIKRPGRAAIELGGDQLGTVIETAGCPPAASGPVAAEGDVREFKQGDRTVLPCLDAAVLRMRRGERALLTAPASCAYGARSFPHADSVDGAHRASEVEVLVELVDFDPPPETNGACVDVIIPLHLERKDAGTRLFGMGALREAAAKWELAETTLPHAGSLKYDLERGGRDKEEVVRLRAQVEKVQLSCRLNLATVYMKLNEPHKSLEYSEKALELDATSAKALLRRAQAHMQIPPVDVDAVKADLLAAAKLAPQDRGIRDELIKLKQINADQKRDERSFYGGIFARAAAQEPPSKLESERPMLATPAPGNVFGNVQFSTTAFGRRQ